MSIRNILFFFLSVLLVIGCSKKDERKLLFSCEGVMYLKSMEESFEPLSISKSVPFKISLYVGDKEVEMNGRSYDICEGKNTIITFGNCEKRENVHFHTFDLVSKKLYDYNYYSHQFRMEKNFPLMVDDIRGEYNCKKIEN
jgi:hypothetical protein